MIRKATLVLIVVVGLVAIAIVVGLPHSRKTLKTCFSDAQGLRSGAAVRIAGVEVGNVRRIHVNPESKDCPAEVDMDVTTSYEMSIPKDSLVGLATAGILGETYVSIDVAHASGPPLENYGYLKSKPPAPSPSAEDYLKAFSSMLGRVGNPGDAGQDPAGSSTSPPPGRPHGKTNLPAPRSP